MKETSRVHFSKAPKTFRAVRNHAFLIVCILKTEEVIRLETLHEVFTKMFTLFVNLIVIHPLAASLFVLFCFFKNKLSIYLIYLLKGLCSY